MPRDDDHAGQSGNGAPARRNNRITAVLSLSGLTCAACVNSVETALLELNGVKGARVTLLPAARATVDFDPDLISTKQIAEKVDDVGYDVVGIEEIQDGLSKSSSTARLNVVVGFGGRGSQRDSAAAAAAIACQHLLEQVGVFEAVVEDTDASRRRSGHFILRIKHDPNVLGIRKLIATAQDALPAGTTVKVAGPLQNKSSQHELNMLILGFVISIVTFVVAMVGMMLLPPENPFRRMLEEPIPGLDIPIGVFITFILATIMEFVVGWKFWHGAYGSLVYAGTANMDVLVVLGTGSAYFFSVYTMVRDALMEDGQLPPSLVLATLWASPSASKTAAPTNDDLITGLGPHMAAHESFYEAAIFVIFFVILGKYLQNVATGKTSEAITRLMQLQPKEAILVTTDPQDGNKILSEQQLPIVLLEVNDLLKVLPGASIPVDGIVVRGSSHIDESLLTGEPIPVAKSQGDNVFGGTVNTGGLLYIRAKKVGDDTAVAKIASLISAAQSNKAQIQSTVDMISRYFVPLVVVLAGLTFAVWMMIPIPVELGDDRLRIALEFAITVLVISCPCGLGLAVPTAVMVGTGVAARYGILVTGGGEALEHAHLAKVFAFDKTGTLSVGKPSVRDMNVYLDNPTELVAKLGMQRGEVLRLAGEVESGSGHPLAKAVVEATIGLPAKPKEEEPPLSPTACGMPNAVIGGRYHVVGVKEVAGRGLLGKLSPAPSQKLAELPKELQCVVGNQSWMDENGCVLPPNAKADVESWRDQGRTIVLLGIVETKTVLAAFAIGDELRSDAAMLVSYLQELGRGVYMLTGDHARTALAAANALGIPPEHAISGIRPEDKAIMVERLGAAGPVAFVGDGVNDAVALAKADLSVAMGTGADVAVASASAVLMNPRLSNVAILVDLSAAVFHRIQMNLLWAFVYNVLGIPIAAGVFLPLGIKLQAWMGGVAMAFSSVSVVGSSLLLRFYRPPKRFVSQEAV